MKHLKKYQQFESVLHFENPKMQMFYQTFLDFKVFKDTSIGKNKNDNFNFTIDTRKLDVKLNEEDQSIEKFFVYVDVDTYGDLVMIEHANIKNPKNSKSYPMEIGTINDLVTYVNNHSGINAEYLWSKLLESNLEKYKSECPAEVYAKVGPTVKPLRDIGILDDEAED